MSKKVGECTLVWDITIEGPGQERKPLSVFGLGRVGEEEASKGV